MRLLVVKSMLGSAACSSSGDSWSAERILGSGGSGGGRGGRGAGADLAAVGAAAPVAAAGVVAPLAAAPGAAAVGAPVGPTLLLLPLLLKARHEGSAARGLSAAAVAAHPADAAIVNAAPAAAPVVVAAPQAAEADPPRARDASSSRALPAKRGAAIARMERLRRGLFVRARERESEAAFCFLFWRWYCSRAREGEGSRRLCVCA